MDWGDPELACLSEHHWGRPQSSLTKLISLHSSVVQAMKESRQVGDEVWSQL